MANQDAAFGLRPLGKIGGSPDNNAATEYEVAACASAFSQNDLMKVINTGTVGIAAATEASNKKLTLFFSAKDINSLPL